MGWYVAAVFVGFLLGFATAAIMSAAKRKDAITPESVKLWLKNEVADPDRVMYQLVRSTYDGKRHISKNPPKGIKRKPREVV